MLRRWVWYLSRPHISARETRSNWQVEDSKIPANHASMAFQSTPLSVQKQKNKENEQKKKCSIVSGETTNQVLSFLRKWKWKALHTRNLLCWEINLRLTSNMVGRTSRRCYVCEKEVELVATMKDHMQKAHSGEFRLSNNLGDVCKTACKICGKVLPLQRMRTHTKDKHGMGITEYKSKFNQVTPVIESSSNQIYFFRTSSTWWKRFFMSVDYVPSR